MKMTCTVRQHQLPEAAVGTERKLISVHFGPSEADRKVYIQAARSAERFARPRKIIGKVTGVRSLEGKTPVSSLSDRLIYL